MSDAATSERFPCPCCSFLTMSERSHDICEVCFWEDDPVQLRDPTYEGGANRVSLDQARATFARLGASEPDFLGDGRPPHPEELPL